MNTQNDPSWFVGLVGFSYPEWNRTFYSRSRVSSGPASGVLLRQYAASFKAVEINTTFYGIPTIKSVRGWRESTPADFRFCVKMPRDVTHGPTPPGALAAAGGPPLDHLTLETTRDTAMRFLEVVESLGNKLGPVLLQFGRKFDATRRDELARFFDRLGHAALLAVEFRHPSWLTSETGQMLQSRGICWTATDESPRREAERTSDAKCTELRPIVVTSDFLYVRWLGKHGQFKNRTKEHFDPAPRLEWWANRLRQVLMLHPTIRTVYGFFDNDFSGYAPATAERFMRHLGLPSRGPNGDECDPQTLFG